MATLKLGIDATKAKAGADQFSKATDKVTDSAKKAGAATDKLGSSSTKAGNSAKRFTGGLSKLGNVSGQTRAKIQNTSFQLQDIAVQLQGGTKASTALAQQLPQLLGGFGAFGAVLGVVAGVGIPALAFAFSSVITPAVAFDDVMDKMEGTSIKLKDTLKILRMSMQELRNEFGDSAVAMRDFAVMQAKLRIAEASGSLKEQASVLRSAALGYIAGAREAGILSKISEEFNVEVEANGDNIRALRAAIADLGTATGLGEMVVALKDFKKVLEESGGSLEKVPKAFATATDEAITLIAEMERLKKITEDVADASLQIEVTPTIPDGVRPRIRPKNLTKPTSRGSGASRINAELKELENFAKKFKPVITLSQEYKNNLDKLNEARQRGAITEQEHAQAVAVATQQFQIGTGALVDYDSVANNFARTLGDNLMALVDGTMSVKDAFKSLATQVIKELYRVLVVQQIVNAAMGAFGYSPAVGGGFTKTPAVTGTGAFGGPVGAGNGMVVGERGPEVFYPQSRGTIVPNNQAGGNVVVNQTFQFAANGDESVKKIIAESAPQIAKLTERSIMDQRRRGGQMKAVFG